MIELEEKNNKNNNKQTNGALKSMCSIVDCLCCRSGGQKSSVANEGRETEQAQES